MLRSWEIFGNLWKSAACVFREDLDSSAGSDVPWNLETEINGSNDYFQWNLKETNCYPQAIASLLDLADGITPAKRECKTEITQYFFVFLQWMALRYLWS